MLFCHNNRVQDCTLSRSPLVLDIFTSDSRLDSSRSQEFPIPQMLMSASLDSNATSSPLPSSSSVLNLAKLKLLTPTFMVLHPLSLPSSRFSHTPTYLSS